MEVRFATANQVRLYAHFGLHWQLQIENRFWAFRRLSVEGPLQNTPMVEALFRIPMHLFISRTTDLRLKLNFRYISILPL